MKLASHAKCRCSGCGTVSKPRVIGVAPPGWRKFVDRATDAVTYRCPKCLVFGSVSR